jgi:hypothetical protein
MARADVYIPAQSTTYCLRWLRNSISYSATGVEAVRVLAHSVAALSALGYCMISYILSQTQAVIHMERKLFDYTFSNPL